MIRHPLDSNDPPKLFRMIPAPPWAKQEHPDDSDSAEWREEEREERQEREWEAADRRDSMPGN